jgi:polygalacturonase
MLMLLDNATVLATTDISLWAIVAPLPSYGRGRDFPGLRIEAFIGCQNCSRVCIGSTSGAASNTIDGQGEGWWDGVKNGSITITPGHLLEFMYSTDIEVANVTLVDSPFWFTHVYASERTWVHDIIVRAPIHSVNTDGVTIDSSLDSLLERLDIANGDDCISVKSGWNQAGVSYGVT